MTHPKHDELAEFLYDELPPARQAEVAQHVHACDDCRAQVASWRGVRTTLAAYEVVDGPAVIRSPGRATHGAARTGLRWAVAAAVLLGAGFGLARMTEKPLDLNALRADLVREVRQEVRQELTAELTTHAARQAQWQEGFEDAVIEVIGQLETRQVASYRNLRKDVETVALRTEQEFGRLIGAAEAPVEQ